MTNDLDINTTAQPRNGLAKPHKKVERHQRRMAIVLAINSTVQPENGLQKLQKKIKPRQLNRPQRTRSSSLIGRIIGRDPIPVESVACFKSTATIVDVQSLDDGTKKVTLRLAPIKSKEQKLKPGQRIDISISHCRVVCDPTTTGHLGVLEVKPGTFRVSTWNPRRRILATIVQNDEEDLLTMASFLFCDAKVGSHCTISPA